MPGYGTALRLRFAIGLLCAMALSVNAAEDFSQWAHSAKVLINTSSTGADVADSVADFPLLIRIASPSPILSETKSGGSDLRFADASGKALDFQIERWDAAAGKGEAWVKIPKIKGGAMDSAITMYWGNISATSASDGSKVFQAQNGFLGVWHLGGTGVQERLNSVGTGNNATPVNYLGNESKEGVIGLADSLNGASVHGAYLDLGPGFADVTHGFTFSVWTEMTATPGSWERVLDIGNPGATEDGQGTDNLIFSREDVTGNMVYQSNTAGIFNAGVRAPGAITAGVWTNFAFTLTGQNAVVYKNGVKVASGTDGTPAKNIQRINNWLGRPNWSGNAFFKGKLDEPVVSLATRSAGWLKLAYENQRPNSRMVSLQIVNIPPTRGIGGSTGDTLFPGMVFQGDSAHWISYPIQAAHTPVLVAWGPAWNPPPRGFDKVGPLFRIMATDSLAAFPDLIAGGDSSDGISLFRDDSGVFTFMPSNNFQPKIQAPGSYFVARDTLPPLARYLGASGSKDSTLASFVLGDNVSNLSCRLLLWKGSADSLGWTAVPAGDTIAISVPFGPRVSEPQEIRLEVSDHAHTVGFPGAGRRLTLSRKLDTLGSPIALKAGITWALAGAPLSYPSLTVAHLSRSSDITGLYGAVWRSDQGASGGYRLLADQDSLPTGAGFWLASQPDAPRIVFPPSHSIASDSEGLFPIRLAHGWNIVTCPSFRAMPWPFSPRDGDAYLRSPVKGLHGFTGSDYVGLDSLQPWRGYFVYCTGKDTVIRIGAGLGAAPKRAAAQDNPQVTARLDLGLRSGSGEPLRLGAVDFASAGLGIEDEPRPPPREGSDGAWLVRDRSPLICDMVAWKASSAMSWKVISRSHSDASLSVTTAALPPGYEAWIVSPARRMKYRLTPGSSIPVAGEDTLDVFAGTTAALAGIGELERGQETVSGFSFRLTSGATGPELNLTLPSAARLEIHIIAPDGKARAGLARRCAAGVYRWDWPSIAGRRAALPQGVSLVLINAQGSGWSARRIEAFGSLR